MDLDLSALQGELAFDAAASIKALLIAFDGDVVGAFLAAGEHLGIEVHQSAPHDVVLSVPAVYFDEEV